METKTTKRVIDLAIAAGRKRQSPRTGFVHFHATDEQAVDTIPIFENFCFAFSLFRQRTVESILEGKQLVERLLAFQNQEGNFPIYLHDFPKCYDPWMGLKIAPVLFHIQRLFAAGIGAETNAKIQLALERLLQFSAGRARPPVWEHRYQKMVGNDISFSPTTSDEWFSWLVTEQLGSSQPPVAEIPYHPDLQAFIGGPEIQEKGEPRPTPLEWILAEKQGFSGRLRGDHLAVLQTSLLFPIDTIRMPPSSSYSWIPGEARLLWGGTKLHSLSCPNGEFLEPGKIRYELTSAAEDEKGNQFEAVCFCDLSSETQLLINGRKGTVFYLGDCIQIQTPALCIELCFELAQGEGDFCGQISRANRPSQIACKGPLLYEVFDWQIGMRTLRRSPHALIDLSVKIL